MTNESVEIAKWIEDGKLPPTTSDFKLSGCTIGHCIPPIFESYCKIFHPFEVTPDEPDILEPNKDYGQKVNLTFSKNTEKGMVITLDGKDILELQKERLKEYASKKWDFVSWKNIADKYGLVFHNQINTQSYIDKFQKIGWQKNLNFPREGYLPRQLLVRLLGLLRENGFSAELFIYQTAPHTIWKNNKSCDLVKCNFDEVLEYFDKDFIGYLYSADRSWTIFTDTDLHFTIVGGQKQLIDALVSSNLELLECAETTRVDDYSDKINLAKPNSWWRKLTGRK